MAAEKGVSLMVGVVVVWLDDIFSLVDETIMLPLLMLSALFAPE